MENKKLELEVSKNELWEDTIAIKFINKDFLPERPIDIKIFNRDLCDPYDSHIGNASITKEQAKKIGKFLIELSELKED